MLSLELYQYGTSRTKEVSIVELNEQTHPQLFADAQQARVKLIEQLTEYDDELANTLIESESFETVSSLEIIKALQKVTQNRVRTRAVLVR